MDGAARCMGQEKALAAVTRKMIGKKKWCSATLWNELLLWPGTNNKWLCIGMSLCETCTARPAPEPEPDQRAKIRCDESESEGRAYTLYSFNYSKSVRFFLSHIELEGFMGAPHHRIPFSRFVGAPIRKSMSGQCSRWCAGGMSDVPLHMTWMHSSATLVCVLFCRSVGFFKVVFDSRLPSMDFLIKLCASFRLSFVRRIFFSSFTICFPLRLAAVCRFRRIVALQLSTLQLTARRTCEYLVLIHLHTAQV